MSPVLATHVKQIAAGVLDVGYVDVGPPDGPAVVLLHGWPYDIHTFAEVSPLLAAAGYRVIVPYLRGYGTTRFLSDETFRNGQQSVLAVDAVALMDALKAPPTRPTATPHLHSWARFAAGDSASDGPWPTRCRSVAPS